MPRQVDSTYATRYGSPAAGWPAANLFKTRQRADVRLVRLIDVGSTVTDFSYDARNRLVESKTSSASGYVLWSTRYSYENDFVARSEYWLNVAAANGFETLSSSTLALRSTTLYSYEPGSGLARRVHRTVGTGVYDDNPGSQTAFNSEGFPIWTEALTYAYLTTAPSFPTPSTQVRRSTSSSLYVRDARNNIIRSVNTTVDSILSTESAEYTYDTGKNPTVFLNPFPADPTSPSNVLTSISRTGKQVIRTTNVYEYRPDGYPIRKTSTVRTEPSLGVAEQSSVTEFVYNH